jgi:hypothetical protein
MTGGYEGSGFGLYGVTTPEMQEFCWGATLFRKLQHRGKWENNLVCRRTGAVYSIFEILRPSASFLVAGFVT